MSHVFVYLETPITLTYDIEGIWRRTPDDGTDAITQAECPYAVSPDVGGESADIWLRSVMSPRHAACVPPSSRFSIPEGLR